jgi:hypothetical protein
MILAMESSKRARTPLRRMKLQYSLPITLLALLLTTGCDKPASQTDGKLAELERKAEEAVQRQLELERQLEDQRIAAELDAIERERMQIEEARAELERMQDEEAAAEAETLRQREEELASREGRVEEIQQALVDQEQELLDRNQEILDRNQQLSERDRELAGREALAFSNPDTTSAPVADYGMFHDSLSAYGSWFETTDYGYVWQPAVVRQTSWRPYTRGRWACSDHGWIWISDEPFGWATYHYGRWTLLRGRGWIWVPGSTWAPAWVSWRSSGNHIGWAPLPPETLCYREPRWDSTVDVTFGIGPLWFNFVETRHFGQPAYRHCLPASRNPLFYQQTVNITHIHVHNQRIICGGPSYGDVSRQTTRRLPFYRLDVESQRRPGRDSLAMRPRVEEDRLRIHAPRIDAEWNDALRPSRVKGRMESVVVERSEEPRPEVTQRFRQAREENRNRANQMVTQLGGVDRFPQRRLEQLEANRLENSKRPQTRTEERRIVERSDQGGARTENRRPAPTVAQTRTGQTRPAPAVTQSRTGQTRETPSAGITPSTRPLTRPPSESTAQAPRPPRTEVRPESASRRPSTTAQVAPPQARPAAETPRELATRSREPQRATEPARQAQADTQRRPSVEPARQAQAEPQRRPSVEPARQPQAAPQRRPSVEPARQPQAEPQRRPSVEPARQAQADSQRRQQAEQEARQQQADTQRRQQVEQARQQQIESQRRQQAEQARQQQIDSQRRQQAEQARQQQLDSQRRQQADQARQQQAEQARQQQAENQRRQQAEQARQQQAEQETRNRERSREQDTFRQRR